MNRDFEFSVVLFFTCLLLISSERPNLSEDDTLYLDPNRYITSGNQNQHVQDVLRKYNQDPRYTSSNPLRNVNRDLLDKLGSTPDPRYADPLYPEQNLRSGRPFGNERDRIDPSNPNRDRYRNQNPSSYNRYDVYPETGRGDPPRQYFENDPQYALREDEILKILAQIDISASQQCNINVRAQWDFETNVNDVNQIRAVSVICYFNSSQVWIL